MTRSEDPSGTAFAARVDRDGQRPRWRREFVVLPLLAALLLSLLGELRLFRLTNGLIFDLAVSGAPSDEPQALVVRAPMEDMPLVMARLRALGARPVAVTADGSAGGLRIVRPTYGIARRVALRDGSERLLQLPADAVMPELEGGQLDDGSLPSGALKGLTAVVGLPRDLDPPRFQPSGLAEARPLGAAEFIARAIHAVRSGKAGTELSGIARALVLLATGLLLPVAMSKIPPRSQVAASVLTVALLVATGLVLVRVAGVLAPVTELTLLAALAGTIAVGAARRDRELRLELLADQAGAHAARNSLISDPRRWIDFFPAAARLTGVSSSLVLEAKPEGDFDVKAAFGPQAGLGAAMLARTEDFGRADGESPKPVLVRALPGWSDARLVRLDSAGDAATYWLYMAIAGDERDAILKAAERLAEYAAQQPGLASPSRRTRRRYPVDVRLFGALTAIISRTAKIRSSFAALQTATALFDGAGVPLQVNSAMERLLRVSGLQTGRSTPVDIAVGLAGIEADAARAMLGELVRHGGAVRLNSNVEIGSRRFSVIATTIAGNLLFEATDVTHQFRLASIQTELATNIDARIRNDLAAIELATELASDSRLTAERRDRALAMIGQATRRTRGALGELGRLAGAAIYVNDSEPYPVNLRSALKQAVAATKTESDKAGLAIKLQLPVLTSLVLAEPEILDELLQAMLEVLASDSARGTTNHVMLREGEEESELVLTGGFGIAAERWVWLLSDEDRSAPRPVRVLQLAAPRVERWGGSLATQSDAGTGYRFTLRLRKG